MADVTMTLDEYEALRRLITSVRESEGAVEEERESRRTRKKTKNDKIMSKAMRQANARAKKKNGDFRKGWDRSRLMSYAHSLRRKMS